MYPSHLRWSDLGQLILFRYPVRCHACLQRDFANSIAVLRLHAERRAERQSTYAAKTLRTRRDSTR
jgi:hypothetical protein